MAQDTKTDDYYPLRWKIADTVEDIFVLHRSKAIGVIAFIGLAFIVFGFFLLGWGGTNSTTNTTSPSSPTTSAAPVDDDENDDDATETTAPPITTTTTSTTAAPQTTTSTTTTAAPTTTTTIAASARAAASAAQIAATEGGPVIELSTTSIKLIGGLPDDAAADEVVELVESIFPDLAIEDLQVIDESFADTETWKFRLSAPDLFGYNSDNLNPTYLPLIDQLADASVKAETWSIEVSGHTDDSGPAPGNQRLSERRAAAAANRLVSQGIPAASVTSVGRGEDEPVATNDTEAGRLANRRVEFLITP